MKIVAPRGAGVLTRDTILVQVRQKKMFCPRMHTTRRKFFITPVAGKCLDASVQTPALNGKREGAGPGGDLLAEVVDLSNVAASNLGLEVLELVSLLGQSALDLLADLDAVVDVRGDALKVLDAKATAGHGASANADTAGGEGALVAGNGVLVAGNVDLLKNGLHAGAVKAVLTQVKEDHVRVGAVGNELVTELLELGLEGLGIGDNALLVGAEFGGLSLLQGDGESGDGVVVGAALVAGEDGEVNGALKVVEGLLARLGVDGADTLAEEDHGTARATQRLVGGGGDNVGVVEWRGDDLGGNEARDVGHVHDKVGADEVSDLAHAGVVNQAAVGRCASHEDLGPVENDILLELVVVDDASLKVDAVGHGLKVGRDSRDPKGKGKQSRVSHNPLQAVFIDTGMIGTYLREGVW
jgi:hypothetical protein